MLQAASKKMVAGKESSKEKREEAERRKEKEKTGHWMKMGGVEEIATWAWDPPRELVYAFCVLGGHGSD